MDISHVTSVELPLVVKDPTRAISMLGGKDKIASTISKNQQPGQIDEEPLELRLRKDPFHHPLQSISSKKEKILLKVSIPRKNLPSDYHDNPSKYLVRQLIDANKHAQGPSHRVTPVAIINKSYSFKVMTDFQASTKNNQVVQSFNRAVSAGNFEQLEDFFAANHNLQDLNDFADKSNYENKDHGLIPPPIFSKVRLPFDYKYQRNVYTVVLRDENGDTRVVRRRNTLKLHSQIIEFLLPTVPDAPVKALQDHYAELAGANLAGRIGDQNLMECVAWLKQVFGVKPIWLRKQLEDIVPAKLRNSVKQALPYVSYIYKSGPWRFCNIAYGTDPRTDKSFWKYQSEYFRVSRLKLAKPVAAARVLPKTVTLDEYKVSESLIFTGTKIPLTAAYQLGDLLDEDIGDLIESTPEAKFFRPVLDAQDGWLTKQVIQTIRHIIRYKLVQLLKEQPIDSSRVLKIVNTDYNDAMEVDELEDESEDDDDLVQDVEDDALDENVMARIDKMDALTAEKLNGLVGFIKQDLLE